MPAEIVVEASVRHGKGQFAERPNQFDLILVQVGLRVCADAPEKRVNAFVTHVQGQVEFLCLGGIPRAARVLKGLVFICRSGGLCFCECELFEQIEACVHVTSVASRLARRDDARAPNILYDILIEQRVFGICELASREAGVQAQALGLVFGRMRALYPRLRSASLILP